MRKILYSVMFVILAASCADIPTDVYVPLWDATVRLPITQQSYRIGDIVKLDDEVRIDSDNNPIIYRITSDTYERSVYIGDLADGLIDGEFVIQDVPVGTLDTAAVFSLPEQVRIYKADIKEGSLSIRYQNTSAENMDVTITVPSLTLAGVPFTISGNAPAGGQLNESRSIAGYTFDPSGISSPDSLYIELNANGNLSPESSDLNIRLSETSFSYVDAFIPTKEIKQVNESIDLDIPDDTQELRNRVEFHDARLVVKVDYETPVTQPFTASLVSPRIVGYYGTDSIVLTKLNGSPIDDMELIDGSYQYTYDTENSNISDFLAFMPQDIVVKGTTFINTQEARGEASDLDELLIDVYIDAGSVMSINSAGFTETEEISFTDDDRENLEKAKQVTLYYELENEVPIVSSISLIFRDANNSELFRKELELGAGDSDISSGNFAKKTYRDSLILDTEEMDMFRRAYSTDMLVSISTNPENDRPFFSPDQTISIKTWADVVILVDLDEETEEVAQ